METKVNLYGASGHCKVIIAILLANKRAIGEIIDDNPKSETILDFPLKKNNNERFEANSSWLISIGNNKIRKIISERMNVIYEKLIHPSAILSPFVKIGEGTVVMAGVIINPDVTIGKHCIINTGAILEHDVVVSDFTHICPGVSLAGDVVVGEGTQIGIGASVIQGIKIGKWATIGAGAVIIRDIPDYAVVVGSPAKIIKYNPSNE